MKISWNKFFSLIMVFFLKTVDWKTRTIHYVHSAVNRFKSSKRRVARPVFRYRGYSQTLCTGYESLTYHYIFIKRTWLTYNYFISKIYKHVFLWSLKIKPIYFKFVRIKITCCMHIYLVALLYMGLVNQRKPHRNCPSIQKMIFTQDINYLK